MNILRQLALRAVTRPRQHLAAPRWRAVSIQTKILVPLFVLMLLSLLGSTISFILTTNATRDSILASQIDEDARRLVAALEQDRAATREAAQALAHDPLLVGGLLAEAEGRAVNESLVMSRRATPVYERFKLDQVIVLDVRDEARVNIAPTYLERISVDGGSLLSNCDTTRSELLPFQPPNAAAAYQLWIVCTPVWPLGQAQGSDDTDTLPSVPGASPLGHVYTVLHVEAAIERKRSELELRSAVGLRGSADDPTIGLDTTNSSVRMREEPVQMGDSVLNVVFALEAEGLSEVVNSGVRVTLISNVITLLLLLGLGVWLARSFTKPIHKLVHIAQAVGEGDLSERSNLTHSDEIGQLGRAFDQATSRISTLLDQQEQTVRERQAILQSIADGVLAIDRDEHIMVINAAAAALLQQDTPEALIGQQLDCLRVLNDPVLVVGMQQVIEQVRSELVDKDLAPTEELCSLGTRVVRLQSAPILGNLAATADIGDGRRADVQGAVVVLQDVTRAAEVDRAKSEFIATASHELRTPLTSLRGFVDIFTLSGTENLNESQVMFLDMIKRQTDNLVQLVNDLLEMARLEQGTQYAERRWVKVNQALDEAMHNLAELSTRREVTVRLDLQADLPPIWIDNMHMRRLLSNLISNSIKYVYSGGQVQIRAYEIENTSQLPSTPLNEHWHHSSDNSLLITVEDDGVGIREPDQPKIFNRFFRSENPLSVEVGGTGLGLAITQSLVELHHGQIGFWSVEGRGTCFWVRFPTPSTDPLDEGHADVLEGHDTSRTNQDVDWHNPMLQSVQQGADTHRSETTTTPMGKRT